jgi:tetratricopeptide (TPR) repeat protein
LRSTHLTERTLHVWVFLALACAWPTAPVAHAEAPADAQAEYDTVVERALAAFDAQRFDEARSLFERAHALQPSARTLRGLGVTAFAQNRYALAKPELEASLIDTRRPLTQAQRDEVTGFLSWMNSSLGTLRLQLSPAHAIALVDTQAVNPGTTLLEPGEHRLDVRASGFHSHEQTIVLTLDKPLDLAIALVALSEPQSVAASPTLHEASAVSVAASAQPQPPHDANSGSVFGQWWFWTAAAIVVGGTVAVVLVATHQPDAMALPQGVQVGTP